ncbi:hypothetical protein D9M68_823190 [compost metagenome]
MITVAPMELASGALGAGVVAALVNQGLVWLKEHRREQVTRRRQQQHAALAIAVALEQFAAECAYAIERTAVGVAEAVRNGDRAPTNGGGNARVGVARWGGHAVLGCDPDG